LKLRARGLTVLRYTGRQLEREPAAVAAEIRARLAS
jgi:very-short-patch-repair endonuclease